MTEIRIADDSVCIIHEGNMYPARRTGCSCWVISDETRKYIKVTISDIIEAIFIHKQISTSESELTIISNDVFCSIPISELPRI